MHNNFFIFLTNSNYNITVSRHSIDTSEAESGAAAALPLVEAQNVKLLLLEQRTVRAEANAERLRECLKERNCLKEGGGNAVKCSSSLRMPEDVCANGGVGLLKAERCARCCSEWVAMLRYVLVTWLLLIAFHQNGRHIALFRFGVDG